MILFYSSRAPVLVTRYTEGREGGGRGVRLERHEYPVAGNPEGKTLVIEPQPNTTTCLPDIQTLSQYKHIRQGSVSNI